MAICFVFFFFPLMHNHYNFLSFFFKSYEADTTRVPQPLLLMQKCMPSWLIQEATINHSVY